MHSNLSGALFALAAFALFATHDVIIKWLGAVYTPFQLIFFATLMSFPLVTVMLMSDRTEAHLRPVHPWWSALRTGCVVVAMLCGFYAFSVLPLAQVYAILFMAPIVITLLSIPILGERVGWRRGLAVLAGLVGVLIVLRPGGASLTLGHLAAITSAVASGTASVIVRRIGRDERPVVLLMYPLMASYLIMGGVLGFVYEPMPVEHLAGVALIAFLGFVAGLLMIAAYRRAEAAIVAPMQYSQILWATGYGAAFFGETVDAATMTGAAVIIAAGLYIVFREARKPASQTPVLRTRSRGYGMSFRISPFLRRSRDGDDDSGTG
ncbi:Permease of the drug/metabolite transporter (DMT) superfamily [Meinhardsimonia xiamenensis]|jgi:drug/metabolite transporter (DMT)-like permease|uniref:Permease of the drug/metabolite transporter (DMT) superfamily n=1 Tax=Meinhardsimonia xiamenensis TaxID=990712 RepID=A0A1G8XS63_9RHOB|nr:DMT family transporter [Meinhardsimonia xiamenensis]PRX37023.1 drug/metabolite transporter (DMT)-like permease [Meinhardsimonia xiamenensis]SDJ93398.1 Permease of the drug/metabolite transporter (DMT) superfamily [Meinhardsimonia xiamenensis]